MEFIQVGMSHGEGVRYPSIGKCIYCGREDLPLTDEHIIPFGLVADALIFEDASCIPCQMEINKHVEQPCLRKQMGAFRTLVGAPTRNPKDRQKPIKIKLGRANDQGGLIEPPHVLKVPPQDVHMCLMSWRLPPAGILFEEEPPREQMRGEPWCRINSASVDKHIRQFRADTGWQGAIAFKAGDIEQSAFMRFLAKIAHGYAIAELGFDAFTHFLPDIILGKSREYCHYIGGQMDVPEPGATEDLFRIVHGRSVTDATTFFVVQIQLFPFYGTPIHEVIVGQRERTPDDIAVREKPSNRPDV